jgi:hypothetical protein
VADGGGGAQPRRYGWPRGLRRRLRGWPRGLRLVLAGWLGMLELAWLVHGSEPPAARAFIGGTVLAGALALASRRWWLGGAAVVEAGLAAAVGWHLAVAAAPGRVPWSLGAYAAAIAALVAWDLGCAARIARLRRRFWDGSLAPADFDHERHLTLALDSVRRLGATDALAELRPGLQALARRAGRPEHYHETRTRAWLTVIAGVQRAHADEPLPRVLERVVSQCRDSRLLERYYSRELLDSPAARAHFIPPDRVPL